MRVLVTGATGLIGSHIALELMNAGHEVRLLVRNPQLAAAHFDSFGNSSFELAQGDMCDRPAVELALEDCDAVVHCAAMVGLDAKNSQQIFATNLAGIDNVIGSAVTRQLKTIIYISSASALYSTDIREINEKSALGTAQTAYARSKIECEKRVRHYQESGAPIIILYPVGVFGPNDPKLSEGNNALIKFVALFVPLTTSGIQCVDARDIAVMTNKLLIRGSAENPIADRYIVGGHFMTWVQFAALLENILSRKIRKMKLPPQLLIFMGIIMDLVKRVIPNNFPMTYESMNYVTRWATADSSHTQKVLDFQFRPLNETMRDTILWLTAEGHLAEKFNANVNASKTSNSINNTNFNKGMQNGSQI
jgi:nucleoside-diphosphate-sugar epimerase